MGLILVDNYLDVAYFNRRNTQAYVTTLLTGSVGVFCGGEE